MEQKGRVIIKELTFLPIFDAAVRKYFAENIYKGYENPFELECYEISDIIPTILYAVPRGMNDEDIMEQDSEWEQGLAQVGDEHSIILQLPHYVYMK